METDILSIRNVSKYFPGVRALSDVILSIRKGEVHVLVGENGAGKSTLIKIICGIYPPDGGKMLLDGEPYFPCTPREAMDRGIRVVYQEFNLLSYLSVAENIFFDQLPRKGIWVDRKKLFRDATETMRRVGLDVDPWMPVELLGVAQMQLVEIAKAVSSKCRVLILDEPTATLSPDEIARLFEIIRTEKQQGLTVIYISHHLKEIYEIGDRITVLRNGELVDTKKTEEIDIPQIVSMMVGRQMDAEYPFMDSPKPLDEPLLEVKGLRIASSPHEISFHLRKGEILGISGLVGSRRTETVRAIFGADKKLGGSVSLEGRLLNIASPKDAVKEGVCLLTEDRKSQGLVLDMSVEVNMSLAALDKFSRFGSLGLIDRKAERGASERMAGELAIKTPSILQLTRNLSGGNQQKVVLAKWILRDAKVLLFDEPTRGIDVGAKYEIYLLLWRLLAEGKGIMIVSSDLNELIGICHRIVVFSNGAVSGEVLRRDFEQERILKYAYRVSHEGGTAE
ncbi:MAG: sugar ABC transporter ATP-binding protein [Synergistaceae bacterium]|jgi:ribose transport system ATP-binding protein|nr:sugar ABC transporter ATP-binding protein [Synergistaceae bacterium]